MNQFKKTSKPKKERKQSAFSKAFLAFLNGTFLGKDHLITKVPYAFFLVIISICYISYGYYAERTVKQRSVLEAEVKDLRSQSLSLQSKLELQKQQSSVAVSIESLELKESVEPPYKINLNSDSADD